MPSRTSTRVIDNLRLPRLSTDPLFEHSMKCECATRLPNQRRACPDPRARAGRSLGGRWGYAGRRCCLLRACDSLQRAVAPRS